MFEIGFRLRVNDIFGNDDSFILSGMFFDVEVDDFVDIVVMFISGVFIFILFFGLLFFLGIMENVNVNVEI